MSAGTGAGGRSTKLMRAARPWLLSSRPMKAFKDLPGWARALIMGAGIGVFTIAVVLEFKLVRGSVSWSRRRPVL